MEGWTGTVRHGVTKKKKEKEKAEKHLGNMLIKNPNIKGVY